MARSAFLAMLGSFIGGAMLMTAGAVAAEWRLVLAGALAWTLGWLTREWLRRSGRIETVDAAFHQTMSVATVAVDQTRVAELTQLLRQWGSAEEKRGSPAFDPWAVQALRHEIRAAIDRDRALDELLRGSRRAA